MTGYFNVGEWAEAKFSNMGVSEEEFNTHIQPKINELMDLCSQFGLPVSVFVTDEIVKGSSAMRSSNNLDRVPVGHICTQQIALNILAPAGDYNDFKQAVQDIALAIKTKIGNNADE